LLIAQLFGEAFFVLKLNEWTVELDDDVFPRRIFALTEWGTVL
jgi:hypothetical protein